MKKLIQSKSFYAAMLAALCAAVLAACLLWNQEGKTEFVPDLDTAGESIDSWVENARPSGPEPSERGGTDASSSGESPSAAQEDDPKASEEKKDNAAGEKKEVIATDLTDSDASRAPAPEIPDPHANAVPGDPNHPPDAGANPQAPPNPNAPAPGSKNGNGEVYDPVFGWVKPGGVEQNPIDSDGDPDKIIGSMG